MSVHRCVVLSGVLSVFILFGFISFAQAQENTEAEVVLLGRTIQDTLATLGEIKYYKLTMPQSLEVTLTLTPAGFDARLVLYRASSVAEIASSTPLNDVDESEGEETVTRLLSSGTYIIGVADFDNRGTGTYSLAISTQLVALFGFSKRYGDVPLTVSFSDLSPGASIWSWDFGDGATSTEQNVSHTYTQAGVYTVTFIVSNNASEIDTLATTVIAGLFEDGKADAGDGTWVLDLDTMDGDQASHVMDVEAKQMIDVEIIAKRAITNAVNLVVDVIYDPADITPVTNIQSEQFLTEVDWFVEDGGIVRYAVNALGPVSIASGGVGTLSFQVQDGFTGQTEIWLAGVVTGNNSVAEVNIPNASVVVQNIVPVVPEGPVLNVDCDGDGDVDFQDFLVFITTFGKKTGEDGFRTACDYDSDGEIGFSDFLTFASNFGRS